MIKVLEKHVADKIAAGEVVDRPVSIVKELVENSIDAGAKAITVEIRGGGKEYIRVTDDGCGISAEDVAIAFRRHATSKITTEKDLDSILTLGFRGEALASICAVSHVELVTKTSDSKTGTKIAVEGSDIIENGPTGCPDGTTVTVRDLFYNVPARRKFMNSDSSEARKIIDLMSRIALTYPDIRISVINGSKPVFNTSGKGNILNCILSVYGTDLGRDLVPVEARKDDFAIKGFVSPPSVTLSSRSRQIYCVNGRVVSSDILERAIEAGYSERLQHGRHPVAFLFLTVPPQKLDVNIHPAKKEVRFDDAFEVEDFVRDAVRNALSGGRSVPEIKEKNVFRLQEEQVKYEAPALEPASSLSPATLPKQEEKQMDVSALLSSFKEGPAVTPAAEHAEMPEENAVDAPFDFDSLTIIGSVFNTYILAHDDDSFYMFDQHAAHERIFYEKLRKQYESSEKYSQQLLIPLNFNVPADVSASEDNWIDQVRGMGYDIECFGNSTYIVRQIPAFMELDSAESFLESLFNEFGSRPDLTNSKVLDRIIIRSCKSAIKGGDVLAAEETEALFIQLKMCDNPFSCPHGRPTFIKLTKYEIERLFKRA